MKQCYTVVLDRMTTTKGILASEPYETGWADEALFFVRIHAKEGKQALRAKAQVSVDGITWIDEGASSESLEKEGDYFFKVREFGGWLRLVIEPQDETEYTVTTSLVLKG